MKLSAVVALACLLASHSLSAQFSQEVPKLVGSGGEGASMVGESVALSADGSTAIVGGIADGGGAGAAWIYTQSGGAWTQEKKLAGTGGQGASVALSADGNTAIVGGPTDNGNAGAAWVFTRSGGVWTQQGKLVGFGAVGAAYQGCSVSLSSDGNTAIVGGYYDNSQAGAAWVFTRSGGVWSQQGSKLVGTGAAGSYVEQGISVSLSADGNTAIVGGPGDTSVGAAWIFTRSGGIWTQLGSKLAGTGATSVALSGDGNTAIVGSGVGVGGAWVYTRAGGVFTQQGSELVGTGYVGAPKQGTSVSLSWDGNIALVGGRQDDGNLSASFGATWVFTRSGGVWTQQGTKLVGTGAVGKAKQGTSVSISGDGSSAIVGGPFDAWSVGAAWTFTRSGGVFSQQGAKLVPSDTVGQENHGRSVALSSDGNTAVVGAPGDEGGGGAVWIFTRSGGVWTQEGSKLVGTGVGGTFPPSQGGSVALSADGNTAIAGGYGDNSGAGAAWIFTRSGGVWTQQGDKLVGTGAVGASAASQGRSVALSGDGSTAIVGGIEDNNGAGAAWVFTRSGSVWTQQGTKLVGTGAAGGQPAYQGVSVALSADGNTAIVGGFNDNGGVGAAWVFTRSGGVFTQQGSKLVGTGAAGAANEGSSVALSADGNTAIVGGPGDNGAVGAAWVFARSGGVWTQVGSKLAGTVYVGGQEQGISVSLSAVGNTAIVGGAGDSSNTGAAWVFTQSGGVWTQQGAKLVGTDTAGAAQLGISVALSGDASTAIVGGYQDAGGTGAAWVFTTIPPPVATVSGGGTICAGQSAAIQAALTGTPPWDVTWSDGFVQTGVAASPASRSVSPSRDTIYTVTDVRNGAGIGSSSGAAFVMVDPAPPTPTASNSGPVCAGATLNLSTPAVTGAAYWWTGPNGFTSATQNPAIAGATTAASGTYSVTITAGGCTSAAGTTVAAVNADAVPPTVTAPAAITVDQTVCCGTFGGATPAGSASLASFVAGGSAVDDCDPTPTRLSAQIGGVDVTGPTCLPAGTTAVTFRFQDLSGKTGTATSNCTVRMYGDLNLDNSVDPSDMVVLRAYFNFIVSPGTPPFSAPLGMANLNHDAAVDPSDAVILRAYFNFVVGCLAP